MDCEKKSLDMIYHCKQCNFETNFRISFWNHFQKDHIKKKIRPFIPVSANCYLCEYCSFSTFSLLVLFKHILRCQDNTKEEELIIAKYQCSFCSHKATCSTTLKYHIIRKHTSPEKIKWYKCNKCDYKVKVKTELNQHVKYRHEFLLHYCNHCKYKAKMEKDLKRHILAKHTAQEHVLKYESNTCNYKIVHKGNLKLHIIRHHTDPTIQLHKCEHCTYKGKTKSDLIQHMDVQHILKEENKKLPNCDNQKVDVTKHFQKKYIPQENVLKYECNMCLYKTIDRSNIRKHIIRCHADPNEIEWFQCEYCTYKGKIKGDLTQHVKTKHLSKWFNCDYCKYKSKKMDGLKKHIIGSHTDLEEIQWF